MNFLNFNFKKALLLLTLIALPLLTINVEQKRTATLWYAQPLSYLSSWTQEFFSGISTGVRGTTSEYLNLIHIKKENAQLHQEMNQLKTQLAVFEELKIELEKYKNLLDFKTNTSMSLIPAEVIARDLVPDHNTITINKGTDDGIVHMQAVLTVSGAVGYVYKAERHISHIMLMTDRYAVIDALLQKTRAHGIVEGKGRTAEFCNMLIELRM